MNRNYTLEDVEALRAKSGISYEEAVALLDKYDGDMARALIELEKRGVINPKKHNKSGENFSAWLQRMWALGMRTRIHVTKNDETLVNLSAIYIILFVIFAPYFATASLILLLILGCRITLLKNSNLYGTVDLQTMVSNAAENIKSSVQSFSMGKNAAPADEDPVEDPVEAPPTYTSDFVRPEPEKPADEAKENDDDDFPSITIE